MGRTADAATLRMRLSLAFVSVALSAVALLTILTAVLAATDVDQLSRTQRTRLTQAVGAVVSASRAEAGGWSRAHLMQATDLTSKIGAQVRISDQSGRTVLVTPGFTHRNGPTDRVPVMVGKQRVGMVSVRFQAGIGRADQRLRSGFWRAIAGAAGLAAVLALLVAVAMSRRITRPVVRLIEAADAVGSGDATARVGSVRGPVELVDLARTFDKMADELAGQEQLRRTLVADVAHELRTPVAVLQAGHEALLDGVVPATPAQLASLRDEVMRLARMVDDLQGLAAAEAAALQLTLRPADLAEIAAAACASLAGHFESGQLTLDTRLDLAPVRADSRWMHQVITNLLGNAVKFTPAGGRVTVSTGTDGDLARLTVADTGVGIEPDQLPHVFERFWRGTNPMRAAGSGIGLAIVAELVRGHDGEIHVTSTPGAGTVFAVSLPRA
ncbi:MAG TPA: ATP-binding protein [Streptosporangiaceae bacterium]|nr:ATP-binding protein [Streptosporangiaceae bacterium]